MYKELELGKEGFSMRCYKHARGNSLGKLGDFHLTKLLEWIRIKDLSAINKAIVEKWLWRFLHSPEYFLEGVIA